MFFYRKENSVDNNTSIRWMIRRDNPRVQDIEHMSFEFPWTEDDFIRCLRQRNCIGMVAEKNEDVAGYMVYELHKNKLQILNFAVDSKYRRQGIGTDMINKLKNKLSEKRRTRILLEVRETNLPAQLFFRENKFRATSILKNFYLDTTDDAYLMEFDLRYQKEDYDSKSSIQTRSYSSLLGNRLNYRNAA